MPAIVYKFRNPAIEEMSQCCLCGVDFSSPIMERRREDGKIFYCPNGHGQSYIETEATKLRKELEAKQRELQRTQDNLKWAQGERDKAQKTVRKLNKRIANGVCPCCTRSFSNLQRHIQTKHPDFKEAQ